MELNFASGALLAFGGLVAGFLNTVAGGGSTITIPLLVEFLGDPRVANGTNRIAILLQNVVGVASFQRGGVLPWKVVAPLIAPVIIGGAGGAYLATHISAEVIRTVLSVVIVAVALSVVMAPRRWQEGGAAKLGLAARIGIFAVIGFYGGLVQAGVGLPLLIGLVLGCGLNLVSANAVKVTLVLGMTAVALPVFVYSGQVAWVPGLILASGNMSGAWIASHLAIRKGAGWIRWVVLVAAIAGALRMLVFR